mgnify:CR=1 FL=1
MTYDNQAKRSRVQGSTTSIPFRATPPATVRRVLGLDVGGRRIGVAISDYGGMIATPLTTLQATPRPRTLEQIAALVQEYEVNEIVVGLPLTLSGEIGPQAQLVQSFVTELEAVLHQSIQFFDERLTTVVAEQMLRDLGVRPEKRKARIDEVAAAIILQDYLDHMRNQIADPGLNQDATDMSQEV